jgi:Peptidase family M48
VLFAVVAGLQLLGIDYFISNLASTLLLDLPNSRAQEREADLIGLRLMSRACYDPGAAPAMFERLGKVEAAASAQGFEFTRTHPRSDTRAKVRVYVEPSFHVLIDRSRFYSNNYQRHIEYWKIIPSAPRLEDNWRVLEKACAELKLTNEGVLD